MNTHAERAKNLFTISVRGPLCSQSHGCKVQTAAGLRRGFV